MEDKYYVPSIEEFHIGFEFESYREEDGWRESKITYPYLGFINELSLGVYSIPNFIRVKHLDQSDIESFGFNKMDKNNWAGWYDYVLESIWGEYGYYGKCTLHVPRMGDFYKVYVHRWDLKEYKIDDLVDMGESKLVFEGTIKNKSELKNLLTKQLTIINE